MREKGKNNLVNIAIVAILLVFGFFFRIYRLGGNFSFWTDENHVAIFVRAILERDRPILINGFSTGVYQSLQYWLGAISVAAFGLNEFALRFPSVIFGSLTVLAVYLLGKALFVNYATSEVSNEKFTSEVLIPLLAAFLTAFLKIQILWSRQARPYQALQFFFVMGGYFVYKYVNELTGLRVNGLKLEKKEVEKLETGNWKLNTVKIRGLEVRNWEIVGFLGCAVCASLFHGLGLVLFFNGILFLVLMNFKKLKKTFLLVLPLFLVLVFLFRDNLVSTFSSLGEINNLYYYRVFLTKNYLILGILGILGELGLLARKRIKKFLLFAIFLGTQTFIVSFVLGQPFVRYFYIVFPFIVLLACYFVNALTSCALRVLKIKRFKNLIFVLFSLVLILPFYLKGKLVLWPQAVYSLNEDMQEVPEVDWKKIYGFVDEKLEENKDAVLVTNWIDTPVWYLGEGKLDYLIRNGQQSIDDFSGAKMINSLEKFKELITEEKKGIFILDSWDDQVPEGVREYCHQNLKREFELDRLYPVQPRYWTVWVYSWGKAPTVNSE